jgi:hypothetical protein
VEGNAQITGLMNLGQLSSSKVVIDGSDNNGSTAALEISSGSQKLIIDGNELDCVTTGMHLNLNSQSDLYVRTNTRRAELNFLHNTGSGDDSGMAIENEGSNNVYWTLYSTNGDGNFELYYKGDIRGEFTSNSGTYASVSDRRLKRNIRPLDGILEKVQRLKPSSYAFRSDRKKESHLGFIAQDVQTVFPELVNESTVGDTDEKILTLEYAGLSVVAIAAVQELLEQQRTENAALRLENREMKNQVVQLGDRLDRLERRLSLDRQSVETATGSKASDKLTPVDDRPILAQNAPNPFRQQTIIQYYVPGTVAKAEIVVFDQQGKKVRTFALDRGGYGQVALEAGTLPAGNYTYSLLLDGAIWRSLPLVLTR